MLARLIGNYLTESLGQTAVVENRPAPAATWARAWWPTARRTAIRC